MRATLHDDLAGDDDPLDPIGKLPWLVIRGVRAHAVGVEHHEVGDEPVADRAAIGKAEAGGGAEVIERTASSKLSSASSRTNWPRTRGKEP